MNPIMEQMPESKRSAELEAALSGLGANDMGTLADAQVSANTLKGEAETMRGQLGEYKAKETSMVSIPTDETSSEDKVKYERMVGVPETSADYGIELFKDEAGDLMLKAFRESGVRKDVGKRLAAKMEELNNSVMTTRAEASRIALEGTKEALGPKGFELAQKGANAMFPGDEMAKVREKYLNDPEALPGMAKVGRVTIESPKVFQGTARGTGGSLYPSMDKRGMR